ncbi:hypothetical protein ACRAWD_08385 [Caulobacter segnis]
MSLLIAALIGLLALAVSREPGGRLWRLLAEAQREPNEMDLAADVGDRDRADDRDLRSRTGDRVIWPGCWPLTSWAGSSCSPAMLIVTRLLPGWRSFKAQAGKAWAGRNLAVRPPRLRPRTPRALRPRRPASKAADDPDFGGLGSGLRLDGPDTEKPAARCAEPAFRRPYGEKGV